MCALDRRLGDAEVDDLNLALPRDQDVGWADVAVDQVERLPGVVGLAVGVGQPVGDLANDQQAEIGGYSDLPLLAAVVQAAEIAALHVLQRQEVLVVHHADLIDRHDVAVRELDRDLRLLDEALQEVLVLRQIGQDFLDHDGLFEALNLT